MAEPIINEPTEMLSQASIHLLHGVAMADVLYVVGDVDPLDAGALANYAHALKTILKSAKALVDEAESALLHGAPRGTQEATND